MGRRLGGGERITPLLDRLLQASVDVAQAEESITFARRANRRDPVGVGLDRHPRREPGDPNRPALAREGRKREKHERRDRRARRHGEHDENLFQAGATARKGTFERESSLGRLLREHLRERARDRTSRRRTRGSGRPRQRRSAPETGRSRAASTEPGSPP